MHILLVIFPPMCGLFLWMYLLTYFMHRGAGEDFFRRARMGIFRGMLVAGTLLLLQFLSFTSSLIGHDWIIFPLIFFVSSLPFSWKHFRWYTLFPLLAWVILFFCATDVNIPLFWSPFHEEIGKLYQSMTAPYPAVMSPFVSLGFGFLENIRYYSLDMSTTQIIARTLFSLPLHIFASMLVFWCVFFFSSRTLWVAVGLVAAILFHMVYNWSLGFSFPLTLVIIVCGYAFYGWSLENGWWKGKVS